jgi:LysM repeat protein
MRFRYSFLLLLASFFSFFAFSQEVSLAQKDTAEIRFLNQRKFYIYQVNKGETLYSIARKFNIPQEEINEFNTDLKDGLKPKMKLWIPATSYQKKIIEKTELKPVQVPVENDTWQVALIIALNFSKNFIIDSSLVDSNVVSETIDKESLANLEFYEGTLKAIDSLKSMNFKISLHLFDSENDSAKTSEILKMPQLKKMNLLLSNADPVITKLINAFSKANQVNFVSCSLNAGELMSDNRQAIAMLPSSVIQCVEMGKIAAKKFKDNKMMVLKTGLTKENIRSAAFKRGWSESTDEKIKEVDYSKGNDSQGLLKNVKDSLSKKMVNVIFVPSSNESTVSKLVNDLKELGDEYKLTIIGLPTWQYFETLDPLLLELYDVHIFTSSFIEYNTNASLNFRKNFFNTYNIEPTDPAFEGFDMMMIMGMQLLKHGKKIRENISGSEHKGLYSSYRFEKNSENSPVENHFITVCKYRNYELRKLSE